MTMANRLQRHLQQQGVAYQLVPHRRSHSARDSADAAAVRLDHIAKAVILQDEQGYVMAVIPGSNWLRLHQLQEELARPLQLAPEADVDRLFDDCRPGAVPVPGAAYGLLTVVDKALDALAYVYFEAGDRETLVQVAAADFARLTGGARRGFFSHPD